MLREGMMVLMTLLFEDMIRVCEVDVTGSQMQEPEKRKVKGCKIKSR